MSFSTSLERRDSAAIVTLRGDLDIATEAQALADFDGAMDGCELVVADLRELDFLDSTGVRVLLSVDLSAKKKGMRFAVVRRDGMVARLLEVTRVGQRFPVVDDPGELMSGGE